MPHQNDDSAEGAAPGGYGDPLPTISLNHIPHPTIPNLFQCCFEYVEPWQWSPETEVVETGRWFFGPVGNDSFSTAFRTKTRRP